jgi:hypothetical protein
MSTALSSTVPEARNTWLAKLVICISAVVALATSQTPRWSLEDEQHLSVALHTRREQTLLLTIDLGGNLYRDTVDGEVALTATANRAATDFTFSARALTQPGILESPPESTTGGPDAGRSSGVFFAARPTLESPNEASLWFEIECAEPSQERRAETCTALFELTLSRESERPLSAQLSVLTQIRGGSERERPGTFEVSLAQVAP